MRLHLQKMLTFFQYGYKYMDILQNVKVENSVYKMNTY
jgi:hypothetical protein